MKEDDARTYWWKEYSGLIIDVSAWLVVPILLALFLGRSLDIRTGLQPLFTLVFIGIAFIFSMYGIIRKSKEIMERTKKIAKEIHHKKEKK